MTTIFDLTNKTVVITGANRGIGLEFTRQLIARQNKVIASCRNPAKATVLNTPATQQPDSPCRRSTSLVQTTSSSAM